MRKRIAAKVFSLVATLVILFLANCIMNSMALQNIEMKYTELDEIYIEAMDLKGQIDSDYTNLKLEANLAALMDNAELVPDIAAGLVEKGADFTAKLDELEALVGKIENSDLQAAFAAYRANLEGFVSALPEIADKAGAGQQKEANAIIDGLYLSIMEEEELQAAFVEQIDLSLGKAEHRFTTKINGTIIFNYIVLVVYLAVTLGVVLIIMRTIVSPAKKASGHLKNIIDKIDNEEGDLTERIPISTQDEVAQLVIGVNGFIERLQEIMQKIQAESLNMMESVEATMSNVNESNNSAENVSATMEELAASMEEVAATLDEIVRGSQELVKAVQSMNGEAEHGAGLVEEIKHRAEEINHTTYGRRQERDRWNGNRYPQTAGRSSRGEPQRR